MKLTGLFIKNNDKNNLLRLTNNLIGILELKQLTFATLKSLGFTEKNEKLTMLILIFSYEAAKHQKVPLYIMKGLSFEFPKNATAFTYDS